MKIPQYFCNGKLQDRIIQCVFRREEIAAFCFFFLLHPIDRSFWRRCHERKPYLKVLHTRLVLHRIKCNYRRWNECARRDCERKNFARNILSVGLIGRENVMRRQRQREKVVHYHLGALKQWLMTVCAETLKFCRFIICYHFTSHWCFVHAILAMMEKSRSRLCVQVRRLFSNATATLRPRLHFWA